ncbi:MAG: multiheme c-type cytochrome [Gemmatimonadota bacterium]|nr:multiheme c-type cytochrome [Gemmatimonadota bacterium]
MKFVGTALTVGILVAMVALLISPASASAEEEFGFVGVKKCKMCHKKASGGNQYGKWLETAHAKAFETLATEEAAAEAKALGIADARTAPECLKCHATAFPVMDKLETEKITLEEGVSCESCHGPGKGYYKKKVMAGITDGTVEAASVGLLAPDEAVCTKCHTAEGNSFYQEFKYEERVKEVAHPIPEVVAE